MAEWRHPSAQIVNRALHAETGAVLGVVAVGVIPQALGGAAAWLLAVALVAGGAAYLALEAAITRWQEDRQKGAGSSSWMAWPAVAADLGGDGRPVGAGAAVSVLPALAPGQVSADVPGVLAVVAGIRSRGMRRTRRPWVWASFAIPVVAAVALAYVLLRDQSETLELATLVFVAGLYLLAAAEDMLREAHEGEEDTRWSAIGVLAGSVACLLNAGSFGAGGSG